jgi:hypothetical protein
VQHDPSHADEPEEASPRQQCIEEYYGDSYETAFDISPLQISSILVDEVSEYFDVEGNLRRTANRNLYGDAEQYEAGKRQLRTLSQFRAFNAANAVAGAGAVGYVVGANISCTVLRED